MSKRIVIRRGEVQSIPTPPLKRAPASFYTPFKLVGISEIFEYMGVNYRKVNATSAIREVGTTLYNFSGLTDVWVMRERV